MKRIIISIALAAASFTVLAGPTIKESDRRARCSTRSSGASSEDIRLKAPVILP